MKKCKAKKHMISEKCNTKSIMHNKYYVYLKQIAKISMQYKMRSKEKYKVKYKN